MSAPKPSSSTFSLAKDLTARMLVPVVVATRLKGHVADGAVELVPARNQHLQPCSTDKIFAKLGWKYIALREDHAIA